MFSKFLIVALIGGVILAAQCPADENCMSCTGTTCIACYKSYLSAGVCKEPTEKVDNCIAYTNATTCEGCDFGYYYKSADKKCVKIDIANCAHVVEQAPTVCVACNNGVQAKDGKCDSGNAKCPTNCDTCILGFCSYCSSGYALDVNLACVKSEVANCYVIDPLDAKNCSICEPGYYDTNEACKGSFRIMGISSIVAFVVAWISF